MPRPNQRNHPIDRLHLSTAVTCYSFIILISAFSWIAFMPQLPTFQVTSITITSLRTNTRGELTATFHVEGVLGNPNYVLSVWYKSLDFELWFDHHTISSAPVEPLPFSTGAETDTPVRARFAAVNVRFPSGVARGIAVQRHFRGMVELGVTLKAQIRYKFGIVGTNVHP